MAVSETRGHSTRSFDDMHSGCICRFHSKSLCKALEEMYRMALPEMQAVNRSTHVHITLDAKPCTPAPRIMQ